MEYQTKFAKNVELANLRSDVDRLVVDKLETTPTDLSKLSNVVKSAVKKTVYDELIKKLMLLELLISVI